MSCSILIPDMDSLERQPSRSRSRIQVYDYIVTAATRCQRPQNDSQDKSRADAPSGRLRFPLWCAEALEPVFRIAVEFRKYRGRELKPALTTSMFRWRNGRPSPAGAQANNPGRRPGVCGCARGSPARATETGWGLGRIKSTSGRSRTGHPGRRRTRTARSWTRCRQPGRGSCPNRRALPRPDRNSKRRCTPSAA